MSRGAAGPSFCPEGEGTTATMLDFRIPLARIVALGAAIATLGVANGVEAQAWLADRDRAEGPGFRVGNLELHPGIGIEAGYDSNVFLEEENPQGSGIMRVTGHVLLSTIGKERKEEGEAQETEQDRQMVQFRGGLNLSYYHYFIDEVDPNLSGDLGLNLVVNPQGPFTLNLRESLGRTIRPFADRAGAETISYGRNQNLTEVELGLRSRAGILQGTLGYGFEIDFFDEDRFQYANSITHHVRGGARWKFLPSTAVLYELDVAFQDYYKDQDQAPTLLSDNKRVNSRIGINGAFTNELSLAALVGYSAGFFDDPAADDYDNANARLELRWQPQQTIRTRLGYERLFRPSFVGNYYKNDKLYAQADFLLLGALLLGVDSSISFIRSGLALDGAAGTGMDLLGTQERREDIRVSAGIFGEYRVTNWLAFNATFRYIGDFTDFDFEQVTDPTTGGLLVPDPGGGYQKFEVWGGVRAFY